MNISHHIVAEYVYNDGLLHKTSFAFSITKTSATTQTGNLQQ